LFVLCTGQVTNPWHVFVDSDDNISVADNRNHRIQVFHQNGNHIKSIGTGQLANPCGVCMDHEGRIIVSENGVAEFPSFRPVSLILITFYFYLLIILIIQERGRQTGYLSLFFVRKILGKYFEGVF